MPMLQWDPPVLEQVTPELVEYYFSAVEGDLGEELQLPIEAREPQGKSGGYSRL